jgi:competence protein ComGC
MSDTFITIMVVMVAVVALFIIPVMATANQNDKVTQTAVQTIVVNTSAKEGKITEENYDEFIQNLYATGNSYSIELEVQILDDNPAKKGQNINKIGENIYYSEFKNSVESKLETDGVYKLKQGDYIKARVQNTNVTFGTQFKNFIYSIAGKDTIAIEASSSALVTTTGK